MYNTYELQCFNQFLWRYSLFPIHSIVHIVHDARKLGDGPFPYSHVIVMGIPDGGHHCSQNSW